MVSHITAKRVPVPGAFDLSKLAHVTKEVTTWAGTAGTAGTAEGWFPFATIFPSQLGSKKT